MGTLRTGLVTAASLTLAACGQAGFDEGFNRSFDKSARESCLKTATASGATADKAEAYCACFVDGLKGLSTQEKMALKPSSPKVQAAVDACKAKAQIAS